MSNFGRKCEKFVECVFMVRAKEEGKMSTFLGIVSFLLFVAALIGAINPKWFSKGEKQLTRKDMLKSAGVFFVLFVIFANVAGSSGDSSATSNNVGQNDQSNTNQSSSEQTSNEGLLNFQGNMNLRVSGNKVIATVNSNVPDGGIFEVTIMNGKFNVQSEFIPIKEGKIVKEFNITKKWGVGYIAGMALFRFTLDKHPQPANIRQVYGEKGEKLSGQLIATNNSGDKYASINAEAVAYPDESTVKNEQQKLFKQAIKSLIKSSKGIIVDVTPRYGERWDMVNVVVSDVWYNSQDYEKERFAETVGGAVEKLVIDAGLDKDTVSVFFVDTYGKDLATPKMLGGYDIEK